MKGDRHVLDPVHFATRSWMILRRTVQGTAVLLAFFVASVGFSQESSRKDGLVLTVPNPIKGDTAELLRKKILDAVDRQKRTIETIVFDFNPGELPAGSTSFGSCLELADLIRKLQLGDPGLPRVTTVAFIHKAVTKHTVLPVLACGQIVFGPDGSLGDVPREELAKATVRTAYREQAKYHTSPDLIQRVVDPDLAMKRVKTPLGERVVSAATFEEWTKQGKDMAVVPRELPGLEPGKVLIDAETALDVGLARGIFGGRGELVDALGLPRRSMTEDWLIDRTPVAWRIEIRGPIDAGKLQSLERRIKYAIGRNANIIIIQIESDAGDIRNVANLANELRSLKDNTGVNPVRTIAWAPPKRALGAGTFLALGCTEIVMASDGVLSDFRYLRPADRKIVSEMLLPLAKSQGYPPLLFEATIEPNTTLVRVRSKANPNGPMQLTPFSEFQIDQKSPLPRWSNFGVLTPGEGGLLTITPPLAREFQVASATDIDTVEALYASLGLEADKVRVSRDDYLDQIAEFFREPWVNFLLIMIGIIGLILEMKLPGTTVPGTVAAICFVLFFWAYSFVGEFTLLAVLLFLLGLIMIAVEIFVVPGITFVGLSGIVLVITSLGLVTLDRWPTTTSEWVSLGSTLTAFGLCLVAAVVGAICLTYYLPTLPYASRLILRPPSEAPASEATLTPSRWLGAVGVAVSTLRPSGKAQFGEDFLDVVTESDYVESGKRLQIIEIEGNRIVVKEI
jgi:membrane-bound serine protease (ClpP class)